jgi:D-3-phosphoglycerate dehydrogenase / 2-oxoglutarate reductase
VANDGVHRAGGTVFGQSMPRLVQVDEHKLEAYLDGVMMVFHHNDVPGIIGKIGTIMGNHKINRRKYWPVPGSRVPR